MERHMPSNELLYLVVVLSAFTGFGATLLTVSTAERRHRRR
jgi:hypothetical protein